MRVKNWSLILSTRCLGSILTLGTGMRLTRYVLHNAKCFRVQFLVIIPIISIFPGFTKPHHRTARSWPHILQKRNRPRLQVQLSGNPRTEGLGIWAQVPWARPRSESPPCWIPAHWEHEQGLPLHDAWHPAEYEGHSGETSRLGLQCSHLLYATRCHCPARRPSEACEYTALGRSRRFWEGEAGTVEGWRRRGWIYQILRKLELSLHEERWALGSLWSAPLVISYDYRFYQR